MTKSSHKTSAQLDERLNVLDFAELANIPVATARKLIKEFGNDATTLMRELSTQTPSRQMAQAAPSSSQQQ
jgi:predicted transcriptional regulator